MKAKAKRTKTSAFKMMKVFDCQGIFMQPGMPDDVKKAFFDTERFNESRSNDAYVCWTLGELAYSWKEEDVKTDEEKQHCRDIRLVDEWLLKHGADDEEEVLIKHWW